MKDREILSASQLAAAAGVGVETIRYYERRGLLITPSRNSRGQREWRDDDRRRLLFIRRAQEHGFQLEEIRELLELRVDGRRSSEQVGEVADAVIRRIDRKVRELREIRRSLLPLRDACTAGGSTGPCPILRALEDDGAE